MDTQTSVIPDIDELQAGHVLCAFCAQMFSQSPNAETVERLTAQRALLLEEPFCPLAADASHALCGELEASERDGTRDALLRAISQDYTYLFYMVGVSHTSPFESVYRTDDHTLFGPTTLEVRDAYRAYGLEFAEQGSQPDDHIGLELLFLSQLLAQTAAALEKGATEQVADILADIRAFLGNHLLIFAPVYLTNLQVRAQTVFYRSVAAITAATLAALSQLLAVEATCTIDATAYLVPEGC